MASASLEDDNKREKQQQWTVSTYAMLVQSPVMIRRVSWSLHLESVVGSIRGVCGAFGEWGPEVGRGLTRGTEGVWS